MLDTSLSRRTWSGRNCQLGWRASCAIAPKSGQLRPSRESPSEGLALESIHSNQMRHPSRKAKIWVHSAIPDTPSWELAPRISVEQAFSLSTYYMMSLPAKKAGASARAADGARDSAAKICVSRGHQRSTVQVSSKQVRARAATGAPKEGAARCALRVLQKATHPRRGGWPGVNSASE